MVQRSFDQHRCIWLESHDIHQEIDSHETTNPGASGQFQGYLVPRAGSFDSRSGSAIEFAQDRTLSLSKGSTLPRLASLAQGRSGSLRIPSITRALLKSLCRGRDFLPACPPVSWRKADQPPAENPSFCLCRGWDSPPKADGPSAQNPFNQCAEGGTRTRTPFAGHRILSPVRLPIPPPRPRNCEL
ncbi:MAG: hypothetical protein HW389_3066 [Bacteroidetes bacterium]|nr:hypothetical protein [Bacteroidota bacterium]